MKYIHVAACVLGASMLLHGCDNADGTKSRPGGAGPGKTEAPQGPSLQSGDVTRGEIAKIINSTGTVRPDITVQVGSEVSGKLLTVDVDFNSIVKMGDILATIDPENLENRVAQAEAVVENRRSDININEASVRRAEVNAAQSKRSLDRREQLFAESAIFKAQWTKICYF